MTQNQEGGIYEIEIQYTDAGLTMNLDMNEWREKIREDFGTFQSIFDFYRKEAGELSDEFLEGIEMRDDEESREKPGIVITNVPQEWQEDPTELANLLEHLHNLMVRMGLGILIDNEIEEEEQLINGDFFKPLIIRQSAFFEDLLKLRCQLEFQEQKGGTLSLKEFDIIDNMGHKSRLRLARLFGVVDEQEHGILQQMASKRNKIAHTAWGEIDSQEQSQIKSTAQKVLSILKSEIEVAEEGVEINEPEFSEFDIGFCGLDVETQNLQLSILDILGNKGNPVSLDYIQRVLPEDDSRIQQRCWRMNEIGYLEMSEQDGPLSITEEGRKLLENHPL